MLQTMALTKRQEDRHHGGGRVEDVTILIGSDKNELVRSEMNEKAYIRDSAVGTGWRENTISRGQTDMVTEER